MHCASPPPVLNVPAGHGMHAEDPSSEMVPGGQNVQLEAPVELVNEDAGQGLQMLLPIVEVKPIAQGRQASIFQAPGVGKNDPEGQGVHHESNE